MRGTKVGDRKTKSESVLPVLLTQCEIVRLEQHYMSKVAEYRAFMEKCTKTDGLTFVTWKKNVSPHFAGYYSKRATSHLRNLKYQLNDAKKAFEMYTHELAQGAALHKIAGDDLSIS